MIDELDVLHGYLHEAPHPRFDLVAETERFLAALRSMPDEPDEPDGPDEPEDPEDSGEPGPRRPGRRRLTRPIALGIGAVAAALLLVVFLIPGVSRQQPLAAAAELQQIADNAGGQAAPSLAAGQYLATTERISLLGTVSDVGSTATPDAQATIVGTFSTFSDRYGGSCIAATSEPAQFAGPVNSQAWKAAGMVDVPADQPISTCSDASASPFQAAPIQSGGIIDVSALPTDPAVLAQQLTTGTTAVPSINTLEPHPGVSAGFERAVYLMVSPQIGATPQFTAALYGALSRIPGVTLVGQQTSHLGVSGLGFTGSSASDGPMIIVDPTDGALLEARDISSPMAFLGLGQSYLAPAPTPSIGTEGGSGGTSIQWLDPVGSPTVVTSLPDGLTLSPPAVIPAAIEATVDPSVAYVQIQPLSVIMATRYGLPSSAGYGADADGRGGSVEYDLHSVAQMRGYAMILEASGLFNSFRFYQAPGQT